MLGNLLASFEAVFPMFVFMGLGAIARKAKLLNQDDVVHMNKVVFRIFLPALVFTNLYGHDIKTVMDVKMAVFIVISQILIYVMAVVVALRLSDDNRTRGGMVQGIARSNLVAMGSVVLANLYGEGGLIYMSLLLVTSLPVSNGLVTAILEYLRGQKAKPKDIVAKVFMNPLIIASAIGLFCVLFDLKLPNVVQTTVGNISGATTPILLFLLGASFNFRSIGRDKRNLFVALFMRQILFPAVGIPVAVLMGFRDIKLATLLIFFGAATAAASYAMAQEMDSDVEFTANVVVLGSITSCVTLFGWIFLLKTLSLI